MERGKDLTVDEKNDILYLILDKKCHLLKSKNDESIEKGAQ